MAESASVVRERAVRLLWTRAINDDGFRGMVNATNPTLGTADVGKIMNRLNTGIYCLQDAVDVLNGVKSL